MAEGTALRQVVRGERGVVLLTVLAAILILTVLLSAVVVSAIDESGSAYHQRGGTQALFLAEAGAYRALAELRHRLTVGLDVGLARADPEELRALCAADQAAQVIARYAQAAGDQWVSDPGSDEALLRLHGGAPLIVRTASGNEVGRLRAAVRVRSATPPNGEHVCAAGEGTESEQYEMWFTYEVESVGMTPRARRAVRLTNRSDAPLPLRIERAGVARWGLLILARSPRWLGSDAVIDGPAHTNGQWWISGTPTFRGGASSAAAALRFANCGSPIDLTATSNPGGGTCAGDRPVFDDGELRLAARVIGLAPNPPNLVRAALGLDPDGPPPTEADIRSAAPEQTQPGRGVPKGIYVAHDGDRLLNPQTHAPTGIYVRGDVDLLALTADEGRQTIIVQMAGPKGRVERKIVFDLEADAVTVMAGDGATATYRGTGNGLIYVDGSIKALFGTVQRDTRLTIAARGPITISDHLVYAEPPRSAGRPRGALLGILSELGDVQIAGEQAPVDLAIDAVVAAPLGKVEVTGLDTLPDKGVLHILGAVAEEELGPIGDLDPATGHRRGYRLALQYDRRLGHLTPPFLPFTDRYVAAWPSPHPLYEKPVWEEIPIP